ncbi:MAG: DUF1592 domain-containing protein [Armatimonadetes bacterium]|nr:DUF1592 domain-containing protein [Armatimonadota bacterium]MBS1710161.1 DUF1592 domain-containing protein [Armatimonadota bacterium]MBX3110051.1 DUF1592 domain-containing protein [Fimbriimonadaceae bacterium]
MRTAPILPTLAVFAFLGAVWAPTKGEPSPQDPYSSLDKQYKADVGKLFDTYCMDCHSGKNPPAGLDFEKFTSAKSVAGAPKLFQKVVQNIRSQVMPPMDPSPTLDERNRMADWIFRALSLDGTAEQPGRVTIRRLNRTEYNYVLRDLLYIDGDFSKDFPSDDVGYGFDNIGDVLTLTPLHIDMYLKAARSAVEKAVVVAKPKIRTASLEKGRYAEPNRMAEDGFVFLTNGDFVYDFPDCAPGDYELRLAMGASAIAVGPAIVEVYINRQLLQRIQITKPGLNDIGIPIRLPAGTATVGLRFTNDYYNANDPNPDRRDRNVLLQAMTLDGPQGLSGEIPDSHRRLLIAFPTATKNHMAAAREVLDRFASRAYRRPVTADESNRLLAIYQLVRDNGDTYEQGIRIGMEAVLVNPNFLFRVELDSSAGPRELSGIELASRLSFFLWRSMPDETLAKLGESGQLKDPKTLVAQVNRMLADPKAVRFSQDFSSQWLEIGRLAEHTADPAQFPGFDDQLKGDMAQEVTLYFQDMLANSRPVTEFLEGKSTYLNFRLARHYQIPGDFDEVFRRVDVSANHRGGILGMGALLTATSNPNRTSPVKRGKFIMDQLLGSGPPPPPPNVGVLDESKEAITSTRIRERLAQHRKDPACASCHRPLDGYGFTLENFDAVGVFRTQDGSFPVDAAGELPGGRSAVGLDGLKGELRSRNMDFVRTLTGKLLMFSLGRGMTPSDEVWANAVAKKLGKDATLPKIITEIILSDSFRKRPAKQAVQ